MNIVELSPFNVQLGGNDPNIAVGHPLPAPVPFGGGSVSDDSDASGVEIGTWYDGTQPAGSENFADLFLADFYIDPDLNPTWFHVKIRAKNDSIGGDVWNVAAFPTWAMYRADDPTGQALDRRDWPEAIRTGTQADPVWLSQWYSASPVLPGEPGNATNWANLPSDWPEMLDPLTTTGLRFGMLCLSAVPTRTPVLDLYEVRLVVACDMGAATPFRIFPRRDSRAASVGHTIRSHARVYPRQS